MTETGGDIPARPGRIQQRSDFIRAARHRKKWVARGLILQICPNETGTMRAGYTITKKTCPKAVDRNRIKRRLRAVTDDVLTSHGQEGFDYVLIGRRETLTRSFADLKGDLKWCLEKLGHKP